MMDNHSQKTEAEWKALLSSEEYAVLREKATELPFTGKYVSEHADGMYRCRGCGNELFSSDTKFDSGSGWPSYTEALPEAVTLEEDRSHGMNRTEVLCSKCGSHLGHLFNDGPKERGGKRYCINSVCLDLQKPSDK